MSKTKPCMCTGCFFEPEWSQVATEDDLKTGTCGRQGGEKLGTLIRSLSAGHVFSSKRDGYLSDCINKREDEGPEIHRETFEDPREALDKIQELLANKCATIQVAFAMPKDIDAFLEEFSRLSGFVAYSVMKSTALACGAPPLTEAQRRVVLEHTDEARKALFSHVTHGLLKGVDGDAKEEQSDD